MTLLYTYNASYAIYEIREAATLQQVGVTTYLSEAQSICTSGTLPAECCIIH